MNDLDILDLCCGTGAWSAPYRDAGYNVRLIDIAQGQDVRLLEHPGRVRGILAAPPCTHLSASGARWWQKKGKAALLDALSAVDACLRLVVACKPAWWCLENPVGRLTHFLGPPAMTFTPCDYGDHYTKRTCLWGCFQKPTPDPVLALEGSRMHRISPSPQRAAERSMTPPGFARAFFEANP